MRAADHALLFRSMVKQVCRRLGYHATFMARPAFPDYFASGWHVHQSLTPVGGGGNAFADRSGKQRLTDLGMQWVAGLLEHAVSASVFTTPTINGYKRYRPDSFAPDRVVWADGEPRRPAARDRRAGLASLPRREPGRRPGREPVPATSPRRSPPGSTASGASSTRGRRPRSRTWRSGKTPLPASLMEAVAALKADPFFTEAFGAPFVDYFTRLKEFEIARFLQHVTDWEHREYFEVF